MREEAQSPSIQYVESLAHASDAISFPAGGRVTRGFTPRASDTWTVDGGPAVAMPAGRASGQAMRAAAGAPVDGAVGPSVDGTSASFTSTSTVGAADSPPAAPVASTGLRREVFGFLPYWEVSDASTTFDWSVLSTVAYFSVGADKNGNLRKLNSDGSVTTGWGGWTSSKMTSIINAAHQGGTRVVLTISAFAWTSGEKANQAALLGSATARANLANQVAAAVAQRGADGVNLDFEPIVSGYADEFTAQVRAIRAALDAIHPGYQLTFDTTGRIGNYPLENATAAGGADAIFIMGYDYRTSSASQAGSISPLSGPVYDLTDTVAAYAARVSPSKLILGVPYYGRAWSTDSSLLHANNISSTKYGTSVTSTYGTAVSLAAEHGRRYDSTEQAPWTAYQRQTCTETYGCVTAWRELYYDDAASLGLRYDLVNRTGLRGAGIWALGYDGTRPELYRALADKFLTDTTAPTVGVTTLAASQRDAGFTVRWLGRDESSMASYDVQVAADGGAWQDWQLATTGTSAIYLGLDGHAYAFRVRGRDSHGNISDWKVTSTSTAASLAIGGFGSVLVDSLNLRAAPDTSAASVGIVNSGDVVAVTGGPVVADGYTWYQVTAPVSQWAPVDAVQAGLWVAAGSASSTFVAARRPIYATAVQAILRDFRITGRNGHLIVAPNDPLPHPVTVSWTNAVALDALQLRVFRTDGTLVGAETVDRRTAGPQALTWDGHVAGAALPGGTYVLQLTGTSGGLPVEAPADTAVSSEIVSAFGVTVDPAAGATFVPLAPVRLLDTRVGNGLSGAFKANLPRTFLVAGRRGIPASAVAVTGNLTVTGASWRGYVALTRTAEADPATSTLNFPAGDNRANGVTATLAPDGTLAAVYKAPTGATVQLVFDVTGYYR